VDLAVLGDCKKTVAAVTALVKENNHQAWRDSFNEYKDKEQRLVIEPEVFPKEGPVKMGEVIERVATQSHEKAIVVTDVGQNQMLSARYSRFTEKRSIVTSGGMGTMGFGLPAAIGATFGRPDRTVCLFVGDGGLQMTIEELGTIMEQQCPVKVVLLNNNYLGNVRQWQELFFDRRYSFTHMLSPDYGKIAEAYRIPYTLVTEREQLDNAIAQMLSAKGPYLLEVAVMEEDNVLPMCCPGDDVDDMLLEIK
jgi:acetolactate synthase-1/2/3 large subunit